MANKLRLDIPLVLPQIADAQDAIVQRLIDDLQGRQGIDKVHVRTAQDDAPAQLCIHHDPEVLPLARIREIVQAAGAQVTERFAHVLWQTEGIGHARRARTVTDLLREVPGVLGAEASATGVVHVDFDRQAGMEEAILKAWMREHMAGHPSTIWP